MHAKIAAFAVALLAAGSAQASSAATPTQPVTAPSDTPQLAEQPMTVSAHAEGSAVLLLTYDARGKAVDIRIERSSGSTELDRAGLLAARKWRFKPHGRAGRTGGTIRVPIEFRKR